jgi:hypothetical protein
MQTVPLQPIPNQTLQIQLGGQACILNIYQTAFALFADVYVGNSLIVAGVICLNLNRIVRSLYLNFVGDLCFFDTVGAQNPQDPIFTGLGSRFQLVYLSPSDLDGAG